MYTLIIIAYAFANGAAVDIDHVEGFESLNMCRAAKDLVINADPRSPVMSDVTTVAYCVQTKQED